MPAVIAQQARHGAAAAAIPPTLPPYRQGDAGPP